MLKNKEDYEVIDDIVEKCIIIKVKQEVIDEKGLYNAVRIAWRLDGENAQKVDYVIAVTDSIVKEVYKNPIWTKVEETGRYRFKAWVADDDIREKYIYKRIPDKYRQKGLANPCLYTFEK